MKRVSRTICTLATLLMSLGAVHEAVANGLAAFSPNPAMILNPTPTAACPSPNSIPGLVPLGGIPLWYQDINGAAVTVCLDPANCGLIGLGDPIFNEACPLSYPDNFPVEAFYSDTVAIFNVGPASARVVLAMEYTFVDATTGALINGPPRPATALGVPFQRHRLILSYPPGVVPPTTVGNFTITHPWGATVFPAAQAKCVNNAGGQKCSMTRDLPLPGALPPNFAGALGGAVAGTQSTFLHDPSAPAGFFGTGAAAASFTGAVPGSANSITVTDPLGNTGTSTTLTLLVGKMFGMEVAPGLVDFGPNMITTPTATNSPVTTITVTNPNTVSGMTVSATILPVPVPPPATPPAQGLTITGPNAADFVLVADTCSNVLLPPAVVGTPPSTCTFTVAFAPKPLAPAPEVAVRTANVSIAATFAVPVGAPVGTPAPSPPPPGLVKLSGTARYAVAATSADPTKGAITGPAVTANAADAGSTPTYTVTPLPKWEVMDINVTDATGPVTPIFTRPANPTKAVTFTAPAITSAQTIVASFMPSGNLTGSGTLGVDDALKALKLYVGMQPFQGDDKAAMKVGPLDPITGRPAPTAVEPDLTDVVLILKRVLNVVTW